MKKYYLIGILVLMALIIYSMFSQENIHDLQGDFQEVAYTRNENNTGPIIRIYAFTVADTIWTAMQQHTDLLPHTKYGTTEAYYFLSKENAPQKMNLKEPKFHPKFEPFCIAKVVKDGMGNISLKRSPYQD